MNYIKNRLIVNKKMADNDRNVFKYLSEFSTMKFNTMDPGEIIDSLDVYINIIVKKFYNWEDDCLNKTISDYEKLFDSLEGIEKIREGLMVLQCDLFRYITKLKWCTINKKTEDAYLAKANVQLIYNPETEINEFVYLMILNDIYTCSKSKGNIFMGPFLVEIFEFIIIRLSTSYSNGRFSWCERCNKIFFNKTRKDITHCSKKCTDAERQKRYRFLKK